MEHKKEAKCRKINDNLLLLKREKTIHVSNETKRKKKKTFVLFIHSSNKADILNANDMSSIRSNIAKLSFELCSLL